MKWSVESSKDNPSIIDLNTVDDELSVAPHFHSFKPKIAEAKYEYNVKFDDALEIGKGKVSCTYQRSFIVQGNETNSHPRFDPIFERCLSLV